MKQILLTDDNTDYRHAVMEFLRFEGYDMVEASDGVEALEKIKMHQPDLILCDIDMPLMDGLTVLENVRRNPETAHIPFVLVTGRSDVVSIKRADDVHVDGYMVKPMDTDALLNLIKMLLNKSEQTTNTGMEPE